MSEHNLDAERAVLGALLLAPERIPEVSAIVRTEDLQEHCSRVLFDCLRDLHAREVPIDFLTVNDALLAEGKFRAIGGAQYLSDVTASVTSAAHASTHARQVRRAACERRAREAASRLAAATDAAEREGARVQLARATADLSE